MDLLHVSINEYSYVRNPTYPIKKEKKQTAAH